VSGRSPLPLRPDAYNPPVDAFPARVSVVICTKDRPQELAECLGSLRRQTRLPEEVIVVDAGTRSAAALAAAALGEAVPLRVVASAPGLPRQRNLGAACATGDLVVFLDDDVLLEPGYLEAIVRVFARVPGPVGGVQGTVTNRRGQTAWARLFRAAFALNRSATAGGRMTGSGNVQWVVAPQALTRVETLTGNNMAFPRQVLREFRFDERLQGYALKEDMDFSYRVSRRYPLYQTPDARLLHRRAPSGREHRALTSRMRVVHGSYLFRKNLPQTVGNRVRFWWSLVGRVLYAAFQAARDGHAGVLVGTLAGIGDILLGRAVPEQVFSGSPPAQPPLPGGPAPLQSPSAPTEVTPPGPRRGGSSSWGAVGGSGRAS